MHKVFPISHSVPLFFYRFSAFVYAIFITPTFLFIDEDWPLEKALPVTICPTQSKLKILSGDPKNSFQIMTINQTCATLKLKKSFDADVSHFGRKISKISKKKLKRIERINGKNCQYQ